MPKAKLMSVEDAAHALGYRITGKLSPELRMAAALKYLEDYKLTKVKPDPAFINKATGKAYPHAIKATEVAKLIKKNDDEPPQP